MKKYILMRILRSLVSIFLVTTLVYTIVYTMVPKSLIFKNDPNYNKMITTPDKKSDYENTIFERMGYIDYMTTKELQVEASKVDQTVTTEPTDANKKVYQSFLEAKKGNWQLQQFKDSQEFYATRDISIFERVWHFYSKLIDVDHPWKVKDASNPNLERYVRFENDPSVGPALVGSGTRHKYLLYFNGSFPFVHQNIVKLNLGTSYPTYANQPVARIITQGQGKTLQNEVTFPSGQTRRSAINIYSRTYLSPSKADTKTKRQFGKDDAYTATQNHYSEPSMLKNSFIIGVIGVIIAYLVGLPIGMLMSRYKDSWFDRLSTGTMTFMLALPSVATIYIIRFFGSMIGLPDSFPILGASSPLSYVLPSMVLGVLSVPGIVVWFRRYMVDQQASDYVRFARAKGLSEAEISQKHLFKNAMVPISNGIPTSIAMTIVGATLTETIFAFPGMGKMLIDSVRAANNSMVVGLVFIFTVVSVFSLLLGDLLMTIFDPRIRLTSKGGK